MGDLATQYPLISKGVLICMGHWGPLQQIHPILCINITDTSFVEHLLDHPTCFKEDHEIPRVACLDNQRLLENVDIYCNQPNLIKL